MINNLKIKVIGAGPTGSLLAIAIASLGNQVDIFDKYPLDLLIDIDRTYAITHSSRKFFQRINIWDEIKSRAFSFDSLSLSDQNLNKHTIFRLNDLMPDNRSSLSIGWIIEHKALMEIILNVIKKIDNITYYQTSSSILDNDNYDYSFASDGKSSSSRNQLALNVLSFRYSKACLTFKILARGLYPNRAYEVFRKDGPLAILPIKGDLCQIVWTAPINICHNRLNYSPSFFLDQLSAAIPNKIQADCLIDKPRLSEIDFLLAYKMYNSTNIILGESAHSLHPVGGQGLNLTIRDINELLNLFSSLSSTRRSKLPAIFSKNRKVDILTTSIITDALLRLFSSTNICIKIAKVFIFDTLLRFRLIRMIILILMTDGINGFLSFKRKIN